MSFGPNLKWIKSSFKKIKFKQIFPFIISIIISYLIIIKTNSEHLFSTILFVSAFYLFFTASRDLIKKENHLSQKISHFGFSLLVLAILLNSVFADEFSANMKIGDEMKFKNSFIKFKKIETYEEKNYKSIVADFEIEDKKKIINLKPEIRIYNQPNILTSEADIKVSFFSDKFLVMNLLKDDDFFNVRYQIKPFMLWIWISGLLLAIGGFLGLIRKFK